MTSTFPDAGTEFGDKVRARLDTEHVIWLTTVNSSGTPQPNPVWFLWDGGSLLTYNLTTSARVRNVARQPQVSLHFNQRDGDSDIVVLTGTATVDTDAPPPDAHEAYLAKYGDSIPVVAGDVASFAAAYSVPIRIGVQKVRGM